MSTNKRARKRAKRMLDSVLRKLAQKNYSRSERQSTHLQIDRLEPRMMLNGDGGDILLRAGFEDAGIAHFTTDKVIVDVGSSNGSATANSVARNSDSPAPVLAFIPDTGIDELRTLTLQLTATDPDGNDDDLVFEFINGPVNATLSADGLFQWTPNEAAGGLGFFSIDVKVTDSDGLSDSQRFRVVVNEVNQAPRIAAIADVTLEQGTSLSLRAFARDDDRPADTLTYSLVEAPRGATISNIGLIQWEPTVFQTNTGQPHRFTVEVNDGNGGVVTESFDVNFNRRLPVLAFIDDFEIDELEPLTVQFSAIDPDGNDDDLVYEFIKGPVNGTLSPEGLFEWTPNESAGGFNFFVIDVKVTDTDGFTDAQRFRVVVNEINQAPRIARIRNVILEPGDPLSIRAFARDDDRPQDTLTYSLTEAPQGARVSNIGQIQWTPTTAQSNTSEPYSFTVEVNDGNGGIATESFDVTFIRRAPVLALIDNFEIDELESLPLQFTATDPDGNDDDLVFEFIKGPVNGSLSPEGAFEWTPNEFAGGFPFFVIDVKVTDVEGLTDSQQFRVVVNEINQIPRIARIGDVNLEPGDSLSVRAFARDNDRPEDTLTYSLTEAPQGATISNIGLIQWTPTTAQSNSGEPVSVHR